MYSDMFLCRLLAAGLLWAGFARADDGAFFSRAHENGKRFDEVAASMQRLQKAWVAQADPKTKLLPERLPGGSRGLKPGDRSRRYTPHNSAADLYPYLVLTARLTDPELFDGILTEMLRNEVRYTTVLDSIPANLDLNSGVLGPPSLFGAGEYAKDGLIAVTELLGRTPWYFRMVDMTADIMKHAPVTTRFGNLPDSDAELNGDVLQTLVRLAPMTGDRRFMEWARRIGDAYIDEVLPGSHGLPVSSWDFQKHKGRGAVRLRDHGNEMVVGLALLYAREHYEGTARAEHYRPVIAQMLDRILESANPDGMLYDEVDAATLKPPRQGLADTWGYVYGAAYAFYQAGGGAKYRDAVRRVLRNLPKYRNYDWESGSFDGYADSIEGAIYLAAREPLPEAFDWIESEMKVMMAMQQPSGFIENWYGEGNYNRTAMLYALYKTQGCRPDRWVPGVRIGAVRDGTRLYLSVDTPAGPNWSGRVLFDFARHRRVMNFDQNYVRLNEFPEWYTVDENTLYRVRSGNREFVRLGSELIAGIVSEPGEWTVEPAGYAPYGRPSK
jgi:hypothetical protein